MTISPRPWNEATKKVKEGHHDIRLYRYQPDLTAAQVLEIIAAAGIMDAHTTTMTHENLVAEAEDKHGAEVAQQIGETPSRQLVKRMTQRRLGNDKVAAEPVETEVTDVKLAMQKANAKGAFVTENEVI